MWTCRASLAVLLQDGLDSEMDLASLDDMRHSIEGDEKAAEIEGDHNLSDAAGSVDGEPAPQEDQQNISTLAGDDGVALLINASGRGTPASQGYEEDRPGLASHEQIADIVHDKSSSSPCPVEAQNECAGPGADLIIHATVAVTSLMDSSAVEIGIERYLGMAEASKVDKESVLQEALRLAVSDRINARM